MNSIYGPRKTQSNNNMVEPAYTGYTFHKMEVESLNME